MKTFVAGHRGMVGAALVRRLRQQDGELVTRTHAELDLTDQRAVSAFFSSERPDRVILAAARAGGILSHQTLPAQFLFENLMIAANVIHSSFQTGVERLLFIGSSAVYPQDAPQPLAEPSVLTGRFDPTHEPYAVAKIAGIKLCESYNRQYGTDYRSVLPTNLYGPGGNFDPVHSHVLPALLRRFHAAVRDGQDEVVIWGTGRARREFLHVDDLAAACLHLLDLPRDRYDAQVPARESHINLGTGEDVTIADLATLLAEVTGFRGRIVFDTTKPDGAPRRQLEVGRAASLGWRAGIPLRAGLEETYRWYCANVAE